MEGFDMCRNVIAAVALAALTGGSLWAQTARTADVQFKAAEHKEQAEGDLRGAIKEYEKVVNGKDRALAAQALLRIAEIHRRLGDAEANKVYERLIRDFKDQADAVSIARARLGAPAPRGTELRNRVVPRTQDAGLVYSAVSPDGRYFSFLREDGAGLTLVVRDLTTGTTRPLSPTTTAAPRTYVYSPVFSADGKQLVYQWCGAQCELRLISLQEQGIPRFRTLHRGRWVDPMSWTPDNRAVVVFRTHDPKSADIALVSTADGSARVLKQNPGPYSRMLVSPDGTNLAFDHPGRSGAWDISILPLNGGSEFQAVDHVAEDRLAGWSPDGKYLLFTSNRNTGSPGVYASAFANGRPDGTSPRFLYPSLGNGRIHSLGVTNSGALFYFDFLAPNGYSEIQVAPFDFATGMLGSGVTVGGERGGSSSGPAWSRDGRYLAYIVTPLAPVASSQPGVAVHDFEGRSSRELRPGLNNLGQLKWSPDGRSLLAYGVRLGTQAGIFRLDAQTGEATRLADGNNPAWSPDGNTIYFRRTYSADPGGSTSRALETIGAAFFARDLTSGSERELIRRPALGAVNISPDGRFIATGADDVAADTRTILLIPTGGGEPRILRVNRPRDGGVPMWAPDSRSVVVRASSDEVWRYPIDGGQPVRLASWASVPAGPQLSPDGKRVAIERRVTPAQSREPGVWVLENFLPKDGKK
jgi:Tol biopolymer transport system component